MTYYNILQKEFSHGSSSQTEGSERGSGVSVSSCNLTKSSERSDESCFSNFEDGWRFSEGSVPLMKTLESSNPPIAPSGTSSIVSDVTADSSKKDKFIYTTSQYI